MRPPRPRSRHCPGTLGQPGSPSNPGAPWWPRLAGSWRGCCTCEREDPGGRRRLVVLDAGMTELIRPALYGAEHPMLALTSLGAAVPADAAMTPVRVDGPICESTDRLGIADLPPLARDDLVAIGVVGAYGSSMASTYNGRPRPPEVGWDGASLRLLRRRGSAAALP
ncbi:MAG: hypothetical protein R3C32_13945 [Chloroflexota bacterium]